jgi:protein O-mannosyl-transferase
MTLNWGFPVILITAGFIVWANSLGGAFLLDDRGHILPTLLGHESGHAEWVTGGFFSAVRPLTQLSFRLNFTLGGVNPIGYHVVNLIIHLLASFLLFALVSSTLKSRRSQDHDRENADQLAFWIALLWMVHPLQTQSVTYLIQRAESLMGLFYLLTVYSVSRSTQSRGWQFAAVAACALGMLSKEVMVTAPIAALLYDRIFLASSFKEIAAKRKFLYAGLVLTWLILIVPILKADAARIAKSAGFGLAGITPVQYALTQPGVILHYLLRSIWPHPLVIDYAWPAAASFGDVALPLLIVVLLLIGTGAALWKWPRIGFLGVWFFLILAPTSSFIPIKDPIFEHRMYLPLAAVIALVVLGVFQLLQMMRQRGIVKGHRSRVLFVWWAVAASAALSVLTITRNHAYGTEIRLWQDTVDHQAENPRAHHNLGVALQAAKRHDQARLAYGRAIAIDPARAMTHYNLGTVLESEDRFEEALLSYTEALRLQPESVKTHINLGAVLAKLGRHDEARRHYAQALERDPHFAEVYYNLGNLSFHEGRFEDASEQYLKALELKPHLADASRNLKIALKRLEKRAAL